MYLKKLVYLLIILSIAFLNLPALSTKALAAESRKWNQTIKKVTNSVVSIRVNAVRPFDTASSTVTQATGFVVDAERGIILTNRHVVSAGPVTAQAVFSNSEEVELKPLYRDPVHDFGFFQYDPQSLEFIEPNALKLAPYEAEVGDEIRVIGNDSGEHMSILSATLARLDRSAPMYQYGGYNDFNTFYFQSAADTSGGSSGSPVINIKGNVVALNAGGNNRSASSFFLPLYKVAYALELIQSNQKIDRGTLGVTFTYQTYDEARRLGLHPSIETQFRKRNKGNGLLTVDTVLPGSSAHGKLKPGDILVSIDMKNHSSDYVTRYEAVEFLLDSNVGKEATIKISRRGKLISETLIVSDLHEITPDEFLEVGGAVLNNFSYQLARQANLPVKGVLVASPGYLLSKAGITNGSIITSLNGLPVESIQQLYDQLIQIKQNEYFRIKYFHFRTPQNIQIANVKFQTNWHSSRLCRRDDKAGIWPCKKLKWQTQPLDLRASNVTIPQHSNKKVNNLASSLVMVKTSIPYHIDGQNYPSYFGTGLIVDVEKGLVVVDRNTVPVKMADVEITFAGSLELPAEVLFIHPTHSFALIQYDSSLLKNTVLAEAELNTRPLTAGESVWLVGYQNANRIIGEKLSVSSVDPLVLPLPSVPQFRETNVNGIAINNPPQVASGVLVDKHNRVRSWWTNYNFGRSNSTIDRGLPIRLVEAMVEEWKNKGYIENYSLEVELRPISIAKAINYGLNEKWSNALQQSNKNAQVLQIAKMFAGSDAFNKLKEGDLLLAVDDFPITDFSELDKAIIKPKVNIRLWREGKEIVEEIETKKLTQLDTREVVIWAGALLQKPHRALSTQYGIENEGVYVSWYWFGSPANRHNLRPMNRIVEFEGETVDSMEAFLELANKYKSKTYIQIRMIDLMGRESVTTIKQDLHYWPTEKIILEKNGWKNISLN
ncbi:trypsin-like peptidase domain-containing protein [Aliikangiella sp. G2MR2-5]|uniref:trypsin-like peptidase domain-containing protein n=1 Tax=Aliikangiella sp. G2MR2-5 TaxID=2788943 RepID=UPI0018AA06F4|nr:trypsin-like peptidase domain-containing protein [Aliikangiella sp. G2MR2-5]